MSLVCDTRLFPTEWSGGAITWTPDTTWRGYWRSSPLAGHMHIWVFRRPNGMHGISFGRDAPVGCACSDCVPYSVPVRATDNTTEADLLSPSMMCYMLAALAEQAPVQAPSFRNISGHGVLYMDDVPGYDALV